MNNHNTRDEVAQCMELHEFVTKHLMRKKFMLVPDHTTAAHSIRSCNEEGIPCVNLECRTIKDLAYELCKEDYGLKNLEFKAIGPEVSVSLMMGILRQRRNELKYFNREEWIDISTASEIITQLNDIRLIGAKKKLTTLAKEKASKKLEDISYLLQEYVNLLEKDTLLDYIEVLKKAISIAKQRKQQEGNASSKVLYAVYANVQAVGMERDFILEYTKGNYCIIKAPEIQGVSVPNTYFTNHKEAFIRYNDLSSLYYSIDEKIENPQIELFRSYGMYNEVKYVVQDILRKKCHFGETQVIYTNSAYALLFYNYAREHQLPISLTEGIPGSHSNSFAFIRDLFLFVRNGYNIGDLKPVLYNFVFKMNYGSNRQGYKLLCKEELLLGRNSWSRWIDKYKQLKYMPANQEEDYSVEDEEEQSISSEIESETQLLKEEAKYDRDSHIAELREFINAILELFPEDLSQQTSFEAFVNKLVPFISTYCIRQNRIWNKEIYQYIETMKSLSLYNNCAASYLEVMEQVLTVLSAQKIKAEEESDNNILVTGCVASGLVIRPNVYVIGLDGDNFPRKGSESPVLLDEERIALGMEFHLASMMEKDSIYSLIEQLSGSKRRIIFGYNYFDTVGIRGKNPSTFYQLLMDNQKVLKSSINKSGFVSSLQPVLDEREYYLHLEKGNEEDKSYRSRQKHSEKTVAAAMVTNRKDISARTYSASSLDVFISCPKRFYYQYIAKLEIPEDNKLDPTIWLDPAKTGTFIHSVLQQYVQQVVINDGKLEFQKDEFERIFKEECDAIAKKIPYQSRNTYLMKRQEYNNHTENYLKKLCNDMESEGFIPVAVEWGFGRENNVEVQIVLDEHNVMKFSGSIDRIDRLADGTYRIVDYKTGKAEKKEMLRTPERDDLIQDFIYAMVYERAIGNEIIVSGSSYDFPCDGNHQLKTSIQEDNISKTKLRLISILEDIKNHRYERCTEHSDKYPDHEVTCKYCDFALLCTAQRNAWEEKE